MLNIFVDLYDRNICLRAPNFSQMDDAQVSKILGIPLCTPIESRSNEPIGSSLPRYTVREAFFDCEGPIKLIDFGGSWRFGNRPANIQVPSIYRPPELLQSPWKLLDDTGLDLWMLGCTVCLVRIYMQAICLIFSDLSNFRERITIR